MTAPFHALRENLPRALREMWLDLLALVWPCACEVCDAPDRQLCEDCLRGLRLREGASRWVLAPAGVRTCVAGPYAGALRSLLIGYKHAGRTGLCEVLGAQLVGPLRTALERCSAPAPAIVTVPSRPERVRERGYRHVDSIVRSALRRCRATRAPGVPGAPGPARAMLLTDALRTMPGRTGQVGLDPAGRERNAALVRVPRRMRTALRGREVVLVDDIVTTGATVLAAARALEETGASVIAIVALCATERHDAIGFEKGVKVRPAMWPPA